VGRAQPDCDISTVLPKVLVTPASLMGSGYPSGCLGPSHALTESLRSLYRQRVAQGRLLCDHDHPRWGGHTLLNVQLQLPRARRIGFSHRAGAF